MNKRCHRGSEFVKILVDYHEICSGQNNLTKGNNCAKKVRDMLQTNGMTDRQTDSRPRVGCKSVGGLKIKHVKRYEHSGQDWSHCITKESRILNHIYLLKTIL